MVTNLLVTIKKIQLVQRSQYNALQSTETSKYLHRSTRVYSYTIRVHTAINDLILDILGSGITRVRNMAAATQSIQPAAALKDVLLLS